MNTKQRDDEDARRILSKVTRYSSDWNEVMTKTLGQVAYEAHTPDYRVQWDDLWLGHRKAWQAAAEAVADHISGREAVTFRQETAVIEAAKAFIAESPNTMVVPWHDLRRAVEALLALQEVER